MKHTFVNFRNEQGKYYFLVERNSFLFIEINNKHMPLLEYKGTENDWPKSFARQ